MHPGTRPLTPPPSLALLLFALALAPPLAAAQPGARSAAGAEEVLAWNAVALRTAAAASFNPPLESRNLALVQVAVFDAVNACAGGYQPYLDQASVAPGASVQAAAATAAHHALLRLYPQQQASLDAALQASLGRLPEGPSREAGARAGAAAAAAMLARRAADGTEEAITRAHVRVGGAGAWVPTPPGLLPALDPGWGQVVPFVLRGGDQFRPGPPPEPGSRRMADDLREVRRMGSATNSSRTLAQTDLARFWMATAPQLWNPLASRVAAARRLDAVEAARLLALLDVAGADALIAAWDAKYHYAQWRPVTAIRAASDGGSPDASWTPLLATPPFPDFVAGHTAYAGAAARVLGEVFGDDPGVPLELTSPTAPGVVERERTFQGVARGVVDARVWAGVHWRTSCEVGKELGEQVGRYVVEHALRPVTAADR